MALFGTKRKTKPAAGEAVFPPRVKGAYPHAAEHHREVLRRARALPDDSHVTDEIMAAIEAEMHARRAASGTLDGPASPRATQLRVRHVGLPDWWEAGRNLFLCAPDVREIVFNVHGFNAPPQDMIVVAGAGCYLPHLGLAGSQGLVVIGDNTVMMSSAFTVLQDTTILIGENTTATWMCLGDARNGGVLVVGTDNMWASGVSFFTDDTHAIREEGTGKRLNLRGGRVVVDRHVWLGDSTKLMGDCYIGHDTVVGTGSFVKGRLPAHHICVGRPARPTRAGVTWTRDDFE